jgi:tetratricopeptide (TPR) repeat protein
LLAEVFTLNDFPSIQLTHTRRTLGAALALTVACLLAYSNSWRGTFIFDDQQSIADNPSIRRLFSLGQVFFPPGDGATVQGRPLLNLSLAINYALGGLNPAGYHAVNLAIHLGASLVLFGLIRRTLQADGIAFAAALLWALHPLQTESVTYIIQRAESLAGLFYLLTLYCLAVARVVPNPPGPPPEFGPERGRRFERLGGKSLHLSVLFCLLGVCTKETVVSAPLAAYAYDAIFLSGSWRYPWRRRRGYYLALMATGVPLAWLIVASHGRGHTVGFNLARPAWQYWLTQFPAMAHYLRLVFWPAPLIFDRGYDLRWFDHPADVIPYALVVGLLLARTGYELVRRTPAGFLGLIFFALLAPTSLVPGYLQTMAEHRMYLPLAPVIVAAVALAAAEPKLRRWRAALLWGTAAAWGALAHERNRVYFSPLALWSDTVERAPANPNSQYNLGNVYLDLRDYPRAMAHYRQAIALRPSFAAAYNNLGNALAFQFEYGSAERQYQQAIVLDKHYPDPHNNLGNVYLREGRVGDAIREYRATLALEPGYLHARHNLEHALEVERRMR